MRGATPELNALTFNSILENVAPPPHLSSPAGPDSPSLPAIVDYVLLNAAALLHVSGRAADWKEGVAIARESIESGGARAAFEGFRDASKRAMGEDNLGPLLVEDDGGVAAKNGFVKSWLRTRGRSSSRNSQGEDRDTSEGSRQ